MSYGSLNGVPEDILQKLIRSRENVELRRKESLENPEQFWSEIAKKLVWTKPWERLLDLSDAPITKWFSGGELNMCYNCLDRHIINGYGNRVALLFESPVTETNKSYTFNQLHTEVSKLAGVLKNYGVRKGDVVMLYLPMVMEGVFAMLACCRLGAIHSAQPNGLPAQDLAVRIDHAKAKVILVGSHGYHANGWVNYKDTLDEACDKASHKVDKVLVLKRLEEVNMREGRDDDWESMVKTAEPLLECVPVEANEPMFFVYTSGSTGEPKAIVHATGSCAARMVCDAPIIAGSEDDETLFITSNLGWIASHSILTYMPLLNRMKALWFEGDPLLTSDPHCLYRLVSENRTTRILLRGGVLKALKALDPEGNIASQYNMDCIRELWYGGERVDSGTIEWAAKTFDTSAFNCYGQSETMGINSLGPDCAFAKKAHLNQEGSLMLPGWDVVIMRPDQTLAERNEIGRIVYREPLPPGALLTLWGDHEKSKTIYFSSYPGYFDTKDEGYLDDDGYLRVECRADEIMKHATIYLSAIAVEEIVISHPDVEECMVISVPDLILKEIPVTLYIAKRGASKSTREISENIFEKVSKHFGEAVTFGKVIPVSELPRTRTGKKHRPVVAALGKGLSPKATGSVENPEVLKDIALALMQAGYGTQE